MKLEERKKAERKPKVPCKKLSQSCLSKIINNLTSDNENESNPDGR